MLAAERRDLLLATLRRDGKIVAKTAAAELGLSEDSIRRDLRELAAEGLCQRVYGGALPVSPAVADYAGRRQVAVAGKERVAAAAVRLIDPGSTVILDGGTTALAVATVGLCVTTVHGRSGGSAAATARAVVPPSRMTVLPGSIRRTAAAATRSLPATATCRRPA